MNVSTASSRDDIDNIMTQLQQPWSLESLGITLNKDMPQDRWMQEKFENSVQYQAVLGEVAMAPKPPEHSVKLMLLS